MTPPFAPPAERGRHWPGLLAVAAASGPVAAVFNSQVGYTLVKWTCAEDAKTLLIVIAVIALTIALAGAWLSWWLRAASRHSQAPSTTSSESTTFVAAMLVGLNLLLALQITWSGIAVYVLSPCD